MPEPMIIDRERQRKQEHECERECERWCEYKCEWESGDAILPVWSHYGPSDSLYGVYVVQHCRTMSTLLIPIPSVACVVIYIYIYFQLSICV